MMSKIPPVSPASIMLVVRSSNTFGYCRMAFAKVAPPSTVVRTPVSVFWNVTFSWLAARISRHCTSGNPASIITENWRKKIAMSLTFTLLVPKVGITNSLPFSRIAPGVIRSRRNCCPSACLFGATRSPEIFCPEASLPENVKTGMVLASPQVVDIVSCGGAIRYSPRIASRPSRCRFIYLALGGCCSLRQWGCRSRPLGQAGAAVDHFLKLFWMTRALYRYFKRNLLLEIGRGQRLVKRLHAELVLSGLHGRINLVNFVFADQVSYRSVGNKDFHNHGAALAADGWQKGLTHDSFQHQGQVSANLRLLVRRKDVNDAVDCRSRRIGVQGTEGQVTSLGNAQRGLDSFEIAHFTAQKHVRDF